MILSEYPAAKWMPAASSAYRVQPGRKVTKLILHITDGRGSAENTAAMFATPGQRTSAHFVIGNDGVIVQAVRLADVAYHAHTANSYSIGIEHSARSPHELSLNDPGLPLSEIQIVQSVELVRWLCRRFGLPMDRAHVQGHAEADPNTDHSDCPVGVAGGWPWGRWCPAAARVA